jgi:hypothetical protein
MSPRSLEVTGLDRSLPRSCFGALHCSAGVVGHGGQQPGQGCVFGSSLSASRCPGGLPGRVADLMECGGCCGRSALRWLSAAAPGLGVWVSSATKTEQVRRAWPLSQVCSGVDRSPAGPLTSLTARGAIAGSWRGSAIQELRDGCERTLPGCRNWPFGGIRVAVGRCLKSYRRQLRIFQGNMG